MEAYEIPSWALVKLGPKPRVCEGCPHPRHYGKQCDCGCRYGALLQKKEK